MLNNAMSIIFAGTAESHLNELTIHRTIASLPYGGRYRFIDFALSNFVNSGIDKIGIITKNNYNSLMDHLRMGRDWDLNRKNGGIVLFPPFGLNTLRDVYRGKIEALFAIRNFIKDAKEEYVVVCNSNCVYTVDYEEVVEKHIASGADITMLAYKTSELNSHKMVVEADENGKVTDFAYANEFDKSERLVNMLIYVAHKDILLNLVEAAYTRGLIDFERDIIFRKRDELKLFVYEVDGYVAVIDDIPSYFKHNMDLLDSEVRKNLFYDENGPIRTKVKDSVPTRYLENASVKNSLIADGCVINGTVENSILFRGVTVEEGAKVKNSIVMEHGVIQKDADISYVITDKSVVVQKDRHLSGYETYPIVIVKGKTV